MKCPNCGMEMVDARFGIVEYPPYVAPLNVVRDYWAEFLMRKKVPRTDVPAQPASVCWQCGTLLVKVQNPAVFRPAEESAAELEAVTPPEGGGAELEAAPPPEGRGTELETAASPEVRGTEFDVNEGSPVPER